MKEDYDFGYDDGRMGLYLPSTRAGQYLEDYVKGNRDGAESRAKRLLGNTEPHRLVPLDLPTRPDPTRAEMAMHLMAASISNHQTVADSKEDFKEEMEQLAWASTVAADALRAALDRKEAK